MRNFVQFTDYTNDPMWIDPESVVAVWVPVGARDPMSQAYECVTIRCHDGCYYWVKGTIEMVTLDLGIAIGTPPSLGCRCNHPEDAHFMETTGKIAGCIDCQCGEFQEVQPTDRRVTDHSNPDGAVWVGSPPARKVPPPDNLVFCPKCRRLSTLMWPGEACLAGRCEGVFVRTQGGMPGSWVAGPDEPTPEMEFRWTPPPPENPCARCQHDSTVHHCSVKIGWSVAGGKCGMEDCPCGRYLQFPETVAEPTEPDWLDALLVEEWIEGTIKSFLGTWHDRPAEQALRHVLRRRLRDLPHG